MRRGQEQGEVNAFFEATSSYWRDIYASPGVFAEIHRDRYRTVLAWIDSLALAPRSKVLEIGCGAGFMAIALAERGFHVHAIDPADAMIELARRHAGESGSADLLCFEVGDVCSLSFADVSFDLVIAIGVLPWLARPEIAMQEIARVTRPGGHVIVTADNQLRLTNLLDPLSNPALAPLRCRAKQLLARLKLRRASAKKIHARCHTRGFIDDVVARVQLVKIRSVTLGFGPFSFMGHTIVPESLGTALHRRLQHLAERSMPVLRSTGAQYIVAAVKSRHMLNQ
jgi:2-polyprenyl-3-methyl-5-hydroxy-6-metoxy-1,4-benzoquinol methylase